MSIIKELRKMKQDMSTKYIVGKCKIIDNKVEWKTYILKQIINQNFPFLKP